MVKKKEEKVKSKAELMSQLNKLDARLGKDVGALKERKKIAKKLSEMAKE